MNDHEYPDAIILRPLDEIDITDQYVAHLNNSSRFLQAKDLTRDDVLRNLAEGHRTGVRHMYAVCDIEDVLGVVKIGDINRRHNFSDLVCVVFPPYQRQGLGATAIRMATDIAFRVHGLRKVFGGIYRTNIGSLKAYLRAGWIIEGILRDHYEHEGKLVDRICVSCFREFWECKHGEDIQ